MTKLKTHRRLLLGACVSAIMVLALIAAAETTRQSLYRQFGPKLLEAIVLVIKDEINLLRAEHGLAERTNQQLVNALQAKLDTLEDYDWMSGE